MSGQVTGQEFNPVVSLTKTGVRMSLTSARRRLAMTQLVVYTLTLEEAFEATPLRGRGGGHHNLSPRTRTVFGDHVPGRRD